MPITQSRMLALISAGLNLYSTLDGLIRLLHAYNSAVRQGSLKGDEALHDLSLQYPDLESVINSRDYHTIHAERTHFARMARSNDRQKRRKALARSSRARIADALADQGSSPVDSDRPADADHLADSDQELLDQSTLTSTSPRELPELTCPECHHPMAVHENGQCLLACCCPGVRLAGITDQGSG